MYHYVVCTLFDITCTGVLSYRSDVQNLYQRNQQRNWQVIQQLLALRTQPSEISHPVYKTVDLSEYNFGDRYIGQQMVWVVSFSVEFADIFRKDNDLCYGLDQDFDRVPIITNLNETVKFDIPTISTRGNDKNICFYTMEQWTDRDFELQFSNDHGK